MTSHITTTIDRHQTAYNKRNFIHTTYSSTNTNPLYSPYSTKVPPIPSIDFCENLLYETKFNEDLGSATSSSYINNISEHYDNTFMHTYDNPIEYLERYTIKQSLINIPDKHENFYDNAKGEETVDNEKSSNKSPILFYLENKRLALYACIISFILLLIIAIGIFLLNKFFRPVVIHTTVNNHYDIMNISNLTTTTTSVRTPLTTTIPINIIPFPYSTCPSDRWGIGCENICKPCGLGVCHSVTGKCICPVDLYGEFCDLWKVNDKPKRGDMMN